MSIKSKLLWSYIFLIIFTTALLGSIIGAKSQKALSNEIAAKNEKISNLILDIVSVRNNLLFDKVYTDLNYASEILESFGPYSIDHNEKVNIKEHSLPTIYAGEESLVNIDKYINKIESVTGAVCSIFVLDSNKLVRISTNVQNKNEDELGTCLDSSSEIYNRITNKLSYYGKTPIRDSWYISGYIPLYDKNNNVIGALGVGHEQLNDYLEEVINKVQIGKTGYVYIINSAGDVIFHPKIKGENLFDYDFTKEIIEKRLVQ
ncbi:Cache 3/Cache 2 fusion domain-containing protein [Oceanirhabdus sp. W0125-5]|uniref:Cache 3/Cache 2 fusion domain-containing protein n=1 Tax=Oceanirhabdus sp. W0125-5 TaxID=2999116 RepID=UPI0022F2B004|nr:Cache 3/Cache 2 fusion domain-containing protein [Oceanirhabdus sp. W0125-5]WBW98634.1 Cache 3/Cache 2 fusion domain-containing protein [Oceanirhabdus sp. W0125-5]